MARVPLVETDVENEIVAEIFRGFYAEGREPIALYRALANAPALLRSYSVLPRGLRLESATPRATLELIVLRTAQLTGSDYEWSHHRATAPKHGVSARQIAELAQWRSSDAFDARERAALRCAEEMHGLALCEEGFAELSGVFNAEEVVEVVTTAALYQAVARILQALDIEVEPEYEQYLHRQG